MKYNYVYSDTKFCLKKTAINKNKYFVNMHARISHDAIKLLTI